MAIKKIYKVSFKGIILPGFDKEQVIDNVHHITRIPKHTIARKFFSGKTVVIRHADSQEYASQLQKTFAQAGIETYIDQYNETASAAEQNEHDYTPTQQDEDALKHSPSPHIETFEDDSAFWNENNSPTTKPARSPIKKIFAAILMSLIISAGIIFLSNSEESDKAKITETPTIQSESTVSERQTAIIDKPKIDKPKTLVIKETPVQAAFLDGSKIQALLKITQSAQLEQVNDLTGLFNIPQTALEWLKQHIQATDQAFIISEQQPLYLFKTQQTAGILLAINKNLSPSIMTDFEQTLTSTADTVLDCLKSPELHLIQTDQYLLLSNIEDVKQQALFKKLSASKQLISSMAQLDYLFSPDNKIQKPTYNIFYLNYFTLTADAENFYLQLDKKLIKNSQSLLDSLNIVNGYHNKLTVGKLSRLSDLVLLIMSQQALSKALTQTFAPEHIVKIRTNSTTNYSATDLQTYQNKLDIELSAQWQSGPFALTTSQFKYNNHLAIELLAKGQNIQNLLEYSHSAYLQIDNVFNTKSENIILQDCTDTSSNKAYFSDLNGEQEAFIENEFLSYQTIETRKEINIKQGFNVQDIKEINGQIVLKLPKNIRIKTIKAPDNSFYLPFEQFSVFLRHHKNNNQLEYYISGKNGHFLTLRAYNYSGDVIETLSLTEQSFVNTPIKRFEQTFSEPIEEIKIFYSKDIEQIKYPFAFKPEIVPEVSQITSTIEDHPPVVINDAALNFPELAEVVLWDAPAWLGKKWSDKPAEHISNSPFYLNLYINKRNDKTDAVLNIKTGLSPFISQNITAVTLNLNSDKTNITEQFIAFTASEYMPGDADNVEITPYLNANFAFEINDKITDKLNREIHGNISLNLPERVESYSEKYLSPGQRINKNDIMLKVIQLDKHKITFLIEGEIKKLVQLKLYNKAAELISEPFEFKHQENNKALLSLLYYDKIDKIKVVLSESATIKKYPFSFK